MTITYLRCNVVGASVHGELAVANLPSASEQIIAPAQIPYQLTFGWDANEALFTVRIMLAVRCTCLCVVCHAPCVYELDAQETIHLLESERELMSYQHLYDVHVCGDSSLNHAHVVDEQLCLCLPAHPCHENCMNSQLSLVD